MDTSNRLPDNLKTYMEKEGQSLLNGYIRFLKCDETGALADILKKSPLWKGGIPFATTAFGDIIAWEDGYIMLYRFPEEDYRVMLSGSDFFFVNLEEEAYTRDFLDIDLYAEVQEQLGSVEKDQCYVMEPIPRLGGARQVKYLNVGDMKGYLQLLVS